MLADDAWETFGPAIEHAQEALRENADTPALIDAFIGIQTAIAHSAFVKASKPGRRMFFAREQAGHEPQSAMQIFGCRIRQPLNDVSVALVARISGRAADDPVTLIRTFSLHGQLVIFHLAHPSKLSMLGWKSIDAEKAALLTSTVRDQTRTLLEHWSRERDEGLTPPAQTTQTTGKGKPRKQQ